MKKSRTVWHSFYYALSGIWYVFLHERNLRLHFGAAAVAAIFGFYYQLSLVEWALLILTCTAVITAEIFNTAVETIVDLVTPKYHPLAKIAKDAAAGAVLIAAVAAILVGYLLFYHKIFV